MPAPMPAAMSTRRSAGRRRSKPPSQEPKPAPIWAIGPSRPPEPPVPSVMALAMIFTSGTRGRNLSALEVIGGDGRVGAVPFRFRGEGVDEEAADQPAQGRHDQQQPPVERLRAFVQQGWQRRLVGGAAGMVADQDFKDVMEDQPSGQIEHHGAQAGDHPTPSDRPSSRACGRRRRRPRCQNSGTSAADSRERTTRRGRS